jgi:hypothetical protein
MTASRRQQALGMILNRHPNLPREECKRLHAILHNCVCTGPEAQNREGHLHFRDHLQGKIAYVRLLHPARAEKLQALFEAIDWK